MQKSTGNCEVEQEAKGIDDGGNQGGSHNRWVHTGQLSNHW